MDRELVLWIRIVGCVLLALVTIGCLVAGGAIPKVDETLVLRWGLTIGAAVALLGIPLLFRFVRARPLERPPAEVADRPVPTYRVYPMDDGKPREHPFLLEFRDENLVLFDTSHSEVVRIPREWSCVAFAMPNPIFRGYLGIAAAGWEPPRESLWDITLLRRDWLRARGEWEDEEYQSFDVDKETLTRIRQYMRNGPISKDALRVVAMRYGRLATVSLICGVVFLAGIVRLGDWGADDAIEIATTSVFAFSLGVVNLLMALSYLRKSKAE